MLNPVEFFHVGQVTIGFHAIQKVCRRLRLPRLKGFCWRQAVKRIVDFYGIEIPGIKLEVLAW